MDALPLCYQEGRADIVLTRLFKQFQNRVVKFVDIRFRCWRYEDGVISGNGAAQLIARMLDSLGKAEGILGTIAGDDTIFITPTAETDIDELYDSVLELFEQTG
jgi:hypothetical protein